MNRKNELRLRSCCADETVTVRWFPPSWVYIDAGEDGRLHIDPVFAGGSAATGHSPADGILITHRHSDHYDPQTVSRLCRPGSVVAGSVESSFDSNSKPMRAGDLIRIGNIEVQAVPAYNTPNGSSVMKVHPQGSGLGFVLRARGVTIYHAGDTDLVPELKQIGAVDLAFVPIGGRFTMGPAEAVETAALVGAKAAVPIHWCQKDPQEFRQAARDGFSGVVVIPKSGRSLGLESLGIR